MRARRVPTDNSLCWGMERLTRSPGFDITRWLPTWPIVCHAAFWKAFDASLPEMLASRATWLDRDENFGLLPMWIARGGLLIFRPEPRGDRFLDVGESLLFVLPLRHTSGQGRAFDNDPAIFCLIKLDVKDHNASYQLLTAPTMLAARTAASLLDRVPRAVRLLNGGKKPKAPTARKP
jgi:hypothetical protein